VETEASLLIVLCGIALFSLFSGPIGRGSLTPPMVFTAFGLLLSPIGLGLIDISVDNGIIHAIAEITLILVLFTDAARINLKYLWAEHDIPIRLLLIGMPLSILAGALAATTIFPELILLEALILAIILAPTDAALGQVVVSSRHVPERIRQALNVESGLNDGIALPLLLFFASFAIANHGHEQQTDWLTFVTLQLVLGPLIGALLGWAGSKAINMAIERRFLSHEFCNIYLLTLAFIAYLAADLAGGNGFISAFAAGVATGNTLKKVNEEIYEFAESEGQLLNLVVFFIFGAVLVPQVSGRMDMAIIGYAVLSLTLVRMIPTYLALIGKRLRIETVLFLGWFGPRGLASILFVLLLLEHAQIAQDRLVLDIVIVTVTLSIFLHGVSALPGVRTYAAALQMCKQRGDDLSAEHQAVASMPLRQFSTGKPGDRGEK